MWDSNDWRWTRVAQLCRAGLEPVLLSHDIPACTTALSLFDQIIVAYAIYEYMGYISQVTDTSQGALTLIDGTMATLALLDAFISTVIYCFCGDGVDEVGDHH